MFKSGFLQLYLISFLLLTGCGLARPLSVDLLDADTTVKGEKKAVQAPVFKQQNAAKPPVKPLKRPIAAKKKTLLCRSSAQVYPKDILKSGERVRITVYREEDLSGIYEISENGQIAFPLIGNIHAAGLTAPQLQLKIKDALSNGYLINPSVNIVAARCLDAK